MKTLHDKSTDDHIFEPKEGQRGLLCSNKKSFRCPFLRYEYIESPDCVDKAFDVLFEELIKSN